MKEIAQEEISDLNRNEEQPVLMTMKLARHVARTRGVRIAYRFVVERPEAKRDVGGPQLRSEGNVEFDVALKWRDVMDQMNLPQKFDVILTVHRR